MPAAERRILRPESLSLSETRTFAVFMWLLPGLAAAPRAQAPPKAGLPRCARRARAGDRRGGCSGDGLAGGGPGRASRRAAAWSRRPCVRLETVARADGNSLATRIRTRTNTPHLT